jgi:hypothetical protein
MVNSTSDDEKKLNEIAKLYAIKSNSVKHEKKAPKKSINPLTIKFTNARPVGVKVVTPVRVMVACNDRENVSQGTTWIIDGETAFTWEWNKSEGRMIRKVIHATSKMNTE